MRKEHALAARPLPRIAGNIIPAGRINPASAKLLNLWPAPNNATASTNNFTTAASTGGDQNQVVWRMDHSIKTGSGFFYASATGTFWTCR